MPRKNISSIIVLMNKKLILTLLVVIGILLLGLAIYYWATPAKSLPHWLPGYEAGVSRTHLKHGLAAAILAVGCGVLAWFTSGKPTTSPENIEKN